MKKNEKVKPLTHDVWISACFAEDTDKLYELHHEHLDYCLQNDSLHLAAFSYACQLRLVAVIDFYCSPDLPYLEKIKENEQNFVFSGLQSALYGGHIDLIDYLSPHMDIQSFLQNKDYAKKHEELCYTVLFANEQNCANIGRDFFKFLTDIDCPTQYLEQTNYQPFMDAWRHGETEALKVLIEHYNITGREPKIKNFLDTTLIQYQEITELMAVFQQKKELEQVLDPVPQINSLIKNTQKI